MKRDLCLQINFILSAVKHRAFSFFPRFFAGHLVDNYHSPTYTESQIIFLCKAIFYTNRKFSGMYKHKRYGNMF